eukprot:GHVU01132251.1.p1 GENE.GHVU01132251.1~~GHVU01132251.1.p1  ORF type:complete len:103 (-),score=5.46 GHVU01132251.1:51-359(-)
MSPRAASIISIQVRNSNIGGGVVGLGSFGGGAADVVGLGSFGGGAADVVLRLACLRGNRRRVRCTTNAQPKRHVPVITSAQRMALTSPLSRASSSGEYIQGP